MKQAIDARTAKNEKVKKIRRSLPTLDERSKSKYRSEMIGSRNKYSVQRSQPRLIDVITSALSGGLISEFEEVGNHMNQSPDPNGRLFVFIAGGFTVNELTAVQQF